MGNASSKSAVRNSTNSTAPLMEVRSPGQTNFPRSPAVHDLTAFDPHQDQRRANEVVVTSFAGDEPESGISRPIPARPLIRRYSELLDPTLLEDTQVRSPSGNLLTSSTYNLRDDRPLSVRERQDKIRQQMMQKRKEAEMAETKSNKRGSAKLSIGSGSTRKPSKRGGCFGCFGA